MVLKPKKQNNPPAKKPKKQNKKRPPKKPKKPKKQIANKGLCETVKV